MHQGKLQDALGTCQGSLPPFLACVTDPVSDAILCLLLLQGRDGPHGESSALAAAGAGLAGQQHSGAGLPSKQLQSHGELRQDQGKSSFSPGSVVSCLAPLPRLQNLAFSNASVFTFSLEVTDCNTEKQQKCVMLPTPPQMLVPDASDDGILQKLRFSRLVSNCMV